MSTLLSPLELERLDQPGADDAACVEALAARVIADLGIEPPINLPMVASMLGVRRVETVAGLDVAGCLVPQEGEFLIQLRADDPLPRRRFTLGHECSHIFLPGFAQTTQFRCSPALRPALSSVSVEALCDLGGSHLLLPSAFVTPDVHASTFGWQAVEQMASGYEASLLASAIRFVQAWPEPAALVVLEPSQKPTQLGTSAPLELRVQWAVTQGRWPYFIRHKSVGSGDIFDRAYQGELVVEHRTSVQGVCQASVVAEAHVQLAPYSQGTQRSDRVLALLRRPAGKPVLRG